MEQKKRILAILGSTRSDSTNESILKHIANSYKDRLDVEIFSGIDRLPHFNPELDNENPPPAVKDFRNKIRSSDAVIICTPEYVFSLPGSLKNAIEWNVSTTIFSNKPVGIIVASASGEKAFESLRLIMTTIEARVAEKVQVLIQGAKGRVDKNGEIQDKKVLKELNQLVESLIESTEEKDVTPTKYE